MNISAVELNLKPPVVWRVGQDRAQSGDWSWIIYWTSHFTLPSCCCCWPPADGEGSENIF